MHAVNHCNVYRVRQALRMKNSRGVVERGVGRANPGAGEVSGMRIISSVAPDRGMSKSAPGFSAIDVRSCGLRAFCRDNRDACYLVFERARCRGGTWERTRRGCRVKDRVCPRRRYLPLSPGRLAVVTPRNYFTAVRGIPDPPMTPRPRSDAFGSSTSGRSGREPTARLVPTRHDRRTSFDCVVGADPRCLVTLA
jgi:hypothetical protein